MQFFSTGIDAVDKMGHIAITGNVIPKIWNKTIVNESGKPQRLAMDILAEIVYWYRPTEVRDERTGNILGWKKRFTGNMLQKDYASLAESFGESERTICRVLGYLEDLGVIIRHRKTIQLKSGTIAHNVLFIELVPERLYELTYPDKEDINIKSDETDINEEYEVIAEEEKPDKMGISTETPKSVNYFAKNGEVVCQNLQSSLPKMAEENTKNGEVVCQKWRSDLQKMANENTKNGVTNTYNTTENTTKITTENTTEINNVSLLDNECSNHFISISKEPEVKSDLNDLMEEISTYTQIIKSNIGYDELMKNFDPEVRQRYDELYQIICDVVCVKRDTVRVNGQDYPYELVKNQFLKLKKEHVEYVAECMSDNFVVVNNIRAYLVTALYNAPTTYSNYVAQEYRTVHGERYESDYDIANKNELEYLSHLRETDREAYRVYLRKKMTESNFVGGIQH